MQEYLIASLGGQPQILTFTLDGLLERGFRLQGVWVVFPGGNPRYQGAFHRLVHEFSQYPPYAGLRLHVHSLTDMHGRPLTDVLASHHLDAAWRQIRDLVRAVKQRGGRVHFSITGGRRVLGMMLYAAAMTYGSPQDKVWHIYTPPEWLARVKDGAQMHVPPETIRLLELPFVPWTAYIPGLRVLLETSPEVLRRLMGEGLDGETQHRCTRVWSRLTPRQRDVLRALVATETRAQAAQQLGMPITTLDTHRKAILQVCREVWGSENIHLAFVRRVFRPWLALTHHLPTLWGDFGEEVGIGRTHPPF